MNKCLFMGNVTKKGIDITFGKNGNAIAKFSISVRKRFVRDGESKNMYVNLVAFGKTAELIGNNFQEGSNICVEAEYTPGSYEKDGQTVYTNDFTVQAINFIPKDFSVENQNVTNNDGGGNEWMQPVSNDTDLIPF